MKSRNVQWLALAVVGLALMAAVYAGAVMAQGSPLTPQLQSPPDAAPPTGGQHVPADLPTYVPAARTRTAGEAQDDPPAGLAPLGARGSRAAGWTDGWSQMAAPGAGAALSATPVITFNITLASATGVTDADADVHLLLYRAKAVVGEARTRSDGFGWFSADLMQDGHYAQVQVGDTLEVWVNGGSTNLGVPGLAATVDPGGDVVAGQISNIPLPAPLRIGAWGNWVDVTTDAAGNFAADLSGLFDISWFTEVGVQWQDLSGNWRSFFLFPQDGMAVFATYAEVAGFTEPGAAVAVTLDHEGDISTASTAADPRSGAWYVFFDEMAPGDVVTADVGGTPVVDTVGDLSLAFDLPNDRATGVGPAGSEVSVMAYRLDGLRPWYPCRTVPTDLGGAFQADFGEGLDTWTWAYAVHHDIARADTVIGVDPPQATVEWSFNEVDGYAAPGAEVTARLWEPGQEIEVVVTTASPYGYYWAGFDTPFSDGLHLEVSADGLGVVDQVLAAPSVQLDLEADTLHGHAAPDTTVRANSYAFNSLGPAFGDYAPSDTAGDFQIDLGALLDVHNGRYGLVRVPAGDDVDQPGWQADYGMTPYLNLNETHDGLSGYVPAEDAAVTLTLRTAGGEVKGIANTQSGAYGYVSGQQFFDDGTLIDIEPGDQVEVETEGWSQTVVAPPITVAVDPAADQVSGTGPADAFVEVRVRYEGPRLRVPTDAEGHFLADYSGLVDIRPDQEVEVAKYDGNRNRRFAVGRAPLVRANIAWDAVDGWFGPGAAVSYTVTDAGGAAKGGGSGVARPDGWMDGVWCGCDMVPGDEVHVISDAGLEAILELIDISGQIDVDADLVSGQMSGGIFPGTGNIWVWSDARQEGYGTDMDIAADGAWSVDLSGEFDLWVGDTAEVWYRDSNGNLPGTQLRTLTIEVNYGHDWIYAGSEPYTTVVFEVVGKATLEAETDGGGNLASNWVNDQWNPAPPDIAPGDTVRVAAAGYKASVDPVGTIEGDADPEADTLAGTLDAPWFGQPLHVRCEVWMEGGPGTDVLDVDSDGGTFTCDLGAAGWDVRPGDTLALRYWEPDGNMVINAFQVPYARANMAGDNVDGWFGPGAAVAYTVTDADGAAKGGGSGTAKPDGWMDGVSCGCDMVPGDEVHVTSDAGFDAVLELIDISGQIDVGADLVSGQMSGGIFPAKGAIEVWSDARWEGDWAELSTDGDGAFVVDLSGEFDLWVGDRVGVWYYDPAGNHVGTELRTLTIEVNYGHDWIYAGTAPNATVTFEVVGKATLEAQADGSGNLYSNWANDQWDPAPPDIAPGDTVLVAAASYEASVDPVGTIEGEVDVDADTLAGTLDAPWLGQPLHVRCEVWMDGGPGIEVWDVNPDGGTFTCDLGAAGWDVMPGDTLALRYWEPDGDMVINAFNPPALGLRVIVPDEGVHGFYEAGHTIWLTVTDSVGTVKATAEVTTQDLPWGTGFETNPEDWTPSGEPQILPYDWVYGTADDGLSSQVQIGTITGQVSTVGDSVQGTIYTPWFGEEVQVECHSWGMPGDEILKYDAVLPDGVDEYTCAWDPVTEWDIRPGQRVGVAYSGPDGNWVAGSFYGYSVNLPLILRRY